MGKKVPLWWRESDWLLRGSSAANQILLCHSGPILSTRYTPPGTRYTPRDQVHPLQTRYPPRPGTPPGPGTPPQPPGAEHAGRYGQHVGGTHPTGMQSCCLMHLGQFCNILHSVCIEVLTQETWQTFVYKSILQHCPWLR